MKVTNDLIVASRIYIALSVVFFLYICYLRMLERCALIATVLQIYRTFPERVSSFFEFISLSFRAALWITLIDYCGEENCKRYYESELVALCRLRFCNCLKSGLYFTKGEELPFACTDRYRAQSIRPCTRSLHRFDEDYSPLASRELGFLRDYINMLRSSTGKGVKIHYDEHSDFTTECQQVFKQITQLIRFKEGFSELLVPRRRELLAPVRIWDKGVILPGAWIMCTTDYHLVFQDVDADLSMCEVLTKSGKKIYKCVFPNRLFDLERMLAGLIPVVKHENFGLVSSGWSFWGINILHSSTFDELFQYLLSGREVFVTKLPGGDRATLVLG